MEIYIPTKGRVFQETYDSLPQELKRRVIFVVDSSETCVHGLRTPPSVKGIGPTRQWIAEQPGDNKFVMLDDDLVFATRRGDEPEKFRDSTPEEITDLFNRVEHMLDSYAHIGVSTREGGNRDTDSFVFNTRLLRILGYRRDVLKDNGVRFDRLELMEDFDVTLQLLRLGYSNIRINWMVHNQRSSNAPGGCSTYRTLEKQSAAARGLAELHPQFVTVVTKQTKTAWNGQERQDVRIQWKQAYESAPVKPREIALLDNGAGHNSVQEGDGA